MNNLGATKIEWQPGEMEAAIANFTGTIKKIPPQAPKQKRRKGNRWQQNWSDELDSLVYGTSKHDHQ